MMVPSIVSNGVRLHYEVAGSGDPLVLVHGLGSSARDWQNQVDALSDKYRVVTLDLRGHGQSEKPRGLYSIEQFADDVSRIIELPGNRPAHVVGLSLGGMIAFQLGATRPELVRSLCVVNSGPEMPCERWRDCIKLWCALFVRWLIVRCFGMRKLGETLGSKLLPEEGQSELRRTFIERWAENDPRAYLASMWALPRWSVADRLASIDCPACIIAADMDYTPLAFKESYAAEMPRAEVVRIPRSRHLTPIDQPAQFNQVLRAFLTQCTASGS